MICAVRLRISWNSRKSKDFRFRPKLNLTVSQVWPWANNVSVCLFSKCKWLRMTFEGYCEDSWFCFVKDQIQFLAYRRCLVNVATVKMLLFLVLINKNGIWKKCLFYQALQYIVLSQCWKKKCFLSQLQNRTYVLSIEQPVPSVVNVHHISFSQICILAKAKTSLIMNVIFKVKLLWPLGLEFIHPFIICKRQKGMMGGWWIWCQWTLSLNRSPFIQLLVAWSWASHFTSQPRFLRL